MNYPVKNKKADKINVTDMLEELIEVIIRNTGIFRHIEIDQVLVCTASNRKNSRGGTYGKLIPLKFKDGEAIQKYRGKYYTIPRIINNGIEQKYIIYFYIPKFFDLEPFEKLRVIFHELYHINEKFNGDIRRMGEMKKAHGFSKKRFDSLFEDELHSFYNYLLNSKYWSYIDFTTNTLKNGYKKILCRRIRVPKPVILEEN